MAVDHRLLLRPSIGVLLAFCCLLIWLLVVRVVSFAVVVVVLLAVADVRVLYFDAGASGWAPWLLFPVDNNGDGVTLLPCGDDDPQWLIFSWLFSWLPLLLDDGLLLIPVTALL